MRYVTLLRAINLGGNNRVSMADLRLVLEALGFENVKSILASGNLIFEAHVEEVSRLESRLESAAKAHLGLDTDFFVRDAEEWGKIVSGNPFPMEANKDPAHLLVMFVRDAPDGERVTALEQAIQGREVVHVKGRHAYIVYPDGIGHSRLTNSTIEKKLGTRGTARNWNTILRLGGLLG